jgi:NhaP-type Na+/H+ or K+/H+ antiporter
MMQPDRRLPKYAAIGMVAGFVTGAISMWALVWFDSNGFERESSEGLVAIASAMIGAVVGAVTGAVAGGVLGAFMDWRQRSGSNTPP